MNDIVERLRSDEPYSEDLCLEAADEITALRAVVERLAKLRTIELEHSNRWLEERDTLRAEVDKLRAALEQIIKFADEWEPETQDDYTGLGRMDAAQIALAALGEEKKG